MKLINLTTAGLLIFLLSALPVFSQVPTFEMNTNGATNSNVISTTPVNVLLYGNTDNPTGATFTNTANVTANYTFTRQAFNNTTTTSNTPFGMYFGTAATGVKNANTAPFYPFMNNLGGSTNLFHTASLRTTATQGIDIGVNNMVRMYTALMPVAETNTANLAVALSDISVDMGELEITFSRPVANPVLQLVGLGATIVYYTNSTRTASGNVGATTEVELLNDGLSFSTLSSNLLIGLTNANKKIVNTATMPNTTSSGATPGAMSGSVMVKGVNITSIRLKMFLRFFTPTSGGNFGINPEQNGGDGFGMGLSMDPPVNISGTVYNDYDGSGNGINNLSGTNLSGLYAVLIDPATNLVLTSVAVNNSNGTYTIPGIQPSSNYVVQLSTSQPAVGSAVIPASLPPNWVATGENNSASTANDGNANATSATFSVGTTDFTNVNFGIEQRPESYDVTKNVVGRPVVGQAVPVAGPSLQGSDPNSTIPAQADWTKQVVITQLPTNNFELVYTDPSTGVPRVVTATDVTNGTKFDATRFSLRPTTTTPGGTNTTNFLYATVDDAGFADLTPATYTLAFSIGLPVVFGTIEAYFNANDDLVVKWMALTETNNAYYQIEASTDGTNFYKIATVQSKTNNGNGANIGYETIISANNIILGAIPVMALFGLIGFKRMRLVWCGLTVLILTAVFFSCNKNKGDIDNGKKSNLYIRIQQVNIDGSTSYSNSIKVVK